MITVALGQIVWGIAYRWISLTNGDNGISIRRAQPFGLSLDDGRGFLLGDARRVPVAFGASRCSSPRLRRQPAWHARPAAADDRARLQRLVDPLSRFPVLGLLERRRRAALPLLQPVRQPADRGADLLGRGAADGDSRRHRNLAGPDRRRRTRRRHEKCRQRLYRALELRRWAPSSSPSSFSCRRAWCPARFGFGAGASQGPSTCRDTARCPPSGEAGHDRARTAEPRKVVRRSARHRRSESRRSSRANGA